MSRWRPVAGTNGLGDARGMTPDLGTHPGCRFPAAIIGHAVWLHHLFSLSRRDAELILAERGVTVTHESIRRWVLKFGTGSQASSAIDGRSQARPGTWTRCSRGSEASSTLSGGRVSLAGGRPARRVARHPRPGPQERECRQAVPQAPAGRAAVQAEAPRHRWAAQLRRGASRGHAGGSTPGQPPPRQPRRDLPQTDAPTGASGRRERQADGSAKPTGAPDATLQVTGAGAAVPFGPRHDLGPLPPTPASHDRSQAPPRSRQSLPDLASGNPPPGTGVKPHVPCRASKPNLTANKLTVPHRYFKVGVILDDLRDRETQPRSLFPTRDPVASRRIMTAMDEINGRFGRGTIRPLATGLERRWGTRHERLSHRYTIRLDDVMRGRAWWTEAEHARSSGHCWRSRLP